MKVSSDKGWHRLMHEGKGLSARAKIPESRYKWYHLLKKSKTKHWNDKDYKQLGIYLEITPMNLSTVALRRYVFTCIIPCCIACLGNFSTFKGKQQNTVCSKSHLDCLFSLWQLRLGYEVKEVHSHPVMWEVWVEGKPAVLLSQKISLRKITQRQ